MSEPAGGEPNERLADDPRQQRYELTIDEEVAAFAQYRAQPELIAFVHTQVGEGWAGRGLGSRLIRFALDDARERRLGVLPFCPFVNGFIQRHRDYADLVPEADRPRFGL